MTTPSLSDSTIALISPIDGIVTTGRPAARYSLIFIGELPRSLGAVRINARPASATHNHAGTSQGVALMTVTMSPIP